MTRDELKGKIAGVIADARNEDYDGCLTMDLDEAVDSILSLIDEERCVWEIYDEEGEYYSPLLTGCGEYLSYEDEPDVKCMPFCPCCGELIEVKEVKA